MILPSILAFYAKTVASLFGLSVSSTVSTDKDGRKRIKSDYFIYLGPRILVTRNGQFERLTGAFSVQCTRVDGKLESCRPNAFGNGPGSRVLFGKRAYREYERLCPPRPRHEPMFRDGDGVEFG